MKNDAPSSEHWNSVYLTKTTDSVSWYRPHLDHSWRLIDGLSLPPSTRVLDVGGGASTFVDDALERGFRSVTVLDLADAALEVSRQRLGARAADVTWLTGDITQMTLGNAAYDLWHDRAVFHFLTSPEAQERYLQNLQRALAPGGYVVMGVFGPNGPEQCSGLPTRRWSGDELFDRLPPGFIKLSTSIDVHTTPRGGSQEFAHLVARRE
jgi:SAM-dependent methyltransferase